MKLIEHATVEVSIKYETPGGTEVLSLAVNLCEAKDKELAFLSLLRSARYALEKEVADA